MVSALLKCKNAIKRALKSKAMLGRDLVAKEFEVCTRDTNGEGNAVVLLSVCPLTTADTLLCFLSVCFSASPLNFLHHPGCFPASGGSAPRLLTGVLPLPSCTGIKPCCHGKGLFVTYCTRLRSWGGQVPVKSTYCLKSA